MTVGSSIHAITRTGPPYCSQTVTSILNTRFNRCYHAPVTTRLSPGHRGSAFCGCAVRLLRLTHAQPPASSRWRNHCAPSAIGRMAAPNEHPMKPGQVNPWTRHQRGQPGKEVQRVENDVGGAVPIRCFKLIANLTVGGE